MSSIACLSMGFFLFTFFLFVCLHFLNSLEQIFDVDLTAYFKDLGIRT